MNDRRTGPGAGAIVGGVVLLFFGLCILLVGGGCTILWALMLFADSGLGRASDGLGLLMISLFAAAAGLAAIVKGVQLLRGPRD